MPTLQSKLALAAIAAGAVGLTATADAQTKAVHSATAATLPAPPAAVAPRPSPIGNPADWFPSDAYPVEARNAGQQGRTGFSVDVDERGRVMQCNVTQTSGSELLDFTTCDLVVRNGQFKPAHDAAGKAVPGVWSSGMRWQLVAGAPAIDDDSN